jgi:hypothetical protein
VLSVIVRWGPIRTAVNGTVVARPVSTTAIRPGGDGTSSDDGCGPSRATPASLASAPRVRGRAYRSCLSAGGLRRGSSCSSPTASWDRRAGGRVSLAPRLGVPANSDLPRRLPVLVAQVRVRADDYGATITGDAATHAPRSGSSRCGGAQAPTDSADGWSGSRPWPPVAETGHSTRAAFECTERFRSEVAAWPGRFRVAARPGYSAVCQKP